MAARLLCDVQHLLEYSVLMRIYGVFILFFLVVVSIKWNWEQYFAFFFCLSYNLYLHTSCKAVYNKFINMIVCCLSEIYFKIRTYFFTFSWMPASIFEFVSIYRSIETESRMKTPRNGTRYSHQQSLAVNARQALYTTTLKHFIHAHPRVIIVCCEFRLNFRVSAILFCE